MLEELQLFQEPHYAEFIIREEIPTYYPFAKSFGSNVGTEIALYQQDTLFIIEATLRKNYSGIGTVEFINNAIAFLFDFVSYE